MVYIILNYYRTISSVLIIYYSICVLVAGIKITNMDDKSVEKEGKNANMLVTNEKNEKKVVNKSKYPRNERIRVSSMILNQVKFIFQYNKIDNIINCFSFQSRLCIVI